MFIRRGNIFFSIIFVKRKNFISINYLMTYLKKKDFNIKITNTDIRRNIFYSVIFILIVRRMQM